MAEELHQDFLAENALRGLPGGWWLTIPGYIPV